MTLSPSTSEMLQFALDLADEADRISMSYYRDASGVLGVEAKADGTLVTRADRAVEAMLRERILARFPSHAILGEEQGYTAGSEGSARWILDPIDGTHGYARGIPIWATLIGLERNGELEIGVASAPALGTRWWAGRGLGAYRAPLPARGHAGERIHVSAIASIEEAQVLYGSHKLCLAKWPATPTGGGFEALLARAWRTRGFGDFWSHCLVAEGSAEVMLEGDISPWDIAALQVIVEEAGGRLTDASATRTIDAGHSVTSNAVLHDQVMRVLAG